MKKHCLIRSIAVTTVTALMTTLMFSSCLKDGDDTMVLPLNDGKISPAVVAAEYQEKLRENGFTVHEGITPPNVEGVYIAAPLALQYASDSYANVFFNLQMTFEQQFMRGMVSYSEQQRDTVEGVSTIAQVIGHDSCFTMYCTQYISEGEGVNHLWSYKTATLISGIITDKGIKDFQYAFVMLEKEATSDYYYNQLAKLKTMRIWNDSDNLASKIR